MHIDQLSNACCMGTHTHHRHDSTRHVSAVQGCRAWEYDAEPAARQPKPFGLRAKQPKGHKWQLEKTQRCCVVDGLLAYSLPQPLNNVNPFSAMSLGQGGTQTDSL